MAKADATWNGTLTEGEGTMRLAGGYEGPYNFGSRFEGKETGTNPEELIAGAHAGCFSMALSGALVKAGHQPESIDTTANVNLRKAEGGGFEIHQIRLVTRARVPGISEEEFQQAAQGAKEGCPVSKALAAVETIELEATLEG
jgi:osmotically inducible protein OsmC